MASTSWLLVLSKTNNLPVPSLYKTIAEDNVKQSTINIDIKNTNINIKNLTKNFEGNIDGESMIESCLYLGKYYKEKNMYDKAYNILMKLKDYEGNRGKTPYLGSSNGWTDTRRAYHRNRPDA